jgi:hypothetical protein
MSERCRLIWSTAVEQFWSRAALQAEIVVLRHQLNVLRRRSLKRTALNNIDRLVFVGLYRLVPQVLDALKIVKPETLIRGTALVSDVIGAGNHDRAVDDRRPQPKFASLFAR